MCAEIIVLHVLHRQRHLILPESRQRQLSWLMKISDIVLSQDLETDNLAETNVFAADAAAAAYSEGGDWLDDLREYLWEDRQVCRKIYKRKNSADKARGVKCTYLMWLDCTDIASDSDELKDFICERSGLYVSSGSAYRSNGGFLRFNIACPQKMLEDGLKRLEKSVKEWKCS